METDHFIVYIKKNIFYWDVVKDVETRFDLSNFEGDRPCLMGDNKKVIGLMKN